MVSVLFLIATFLGIPQVEPQADVDVIHSLLLERLDQRYTVQSVNPTYLIGATTGTGTGGDAGCMLRANYQLPAAFQRLEKDLVEVQVDYNARKQTSTAVSSTLKLSRPIVLLNAADVTAFGVSFGRGSSNPNHAFRGSRDLFYLANVYFNANRTVAVGRVTIHNGPWTSQLFEKTGGKWIALGSGCTSAF